MRVGVEQYERLLRPVHGLQRQLPAFTEWDFSEVEDRPREFQHLVRLDRVVFHIDALLQRSHIGRCQRIRRFRRGPAGNGGNKRQKE